MRVSAITDKGMVRTSNQDYYYASSEEDFPLFIVADGMGGHKAGEIASRMVVDLVVDYFYTNKDMLDSREKILEAIKSSIQEANTKANIKSLNTEDCLGMGTTIIIAYIFEDDILLGHVGDSRAYLIRQDEISQITEDHSLVNELIKNGSISREEAKNHPQKNLITRAVGTDVDINIDTYSIKYQKEDILLICSDGLTNMLEDIIILKQSKEDRDIDVLSENLLKSAKDNGGLDNITLIIIKFL